MLLAVVASPMVVRATPAMPIVIVQLADGWSLPFAVYEGEGPSRRLVGGYIHDWYEALGRELGVHLEVRVLPPSRIRAGQGRDTEGLRCFTDPGWDTAYVQRRFDRLETPHLVTREVLVGRRESPLVTSPAQLAGKTIGTVLGYAYPHLDARFERGDMRRDDAPAEANLLEKQLAGRTDYAVIRLSTLRALQARDARWKALVASPWVVDETRFHCAVRQGGPIPIAALREAQARLAKDGTMARLDARYGLD